MEKSIEKGLEYLKGLGKGPFSLQDCEQAIRKALVSYITESDKSKTFTDVKSN